MNLRTDIVLLIMKVEKQIVGLLQSHNLITSKSKDLQNAELTPEALALIGMGDELVTEEWLAEWRKLWPRGSRGNPGIIRKKLNRFLREEESDLVKIMRATEAYIQDKGSQYCGNADYFFYKKTDSGTISRCREYLEVMQDAGEDNDLFGSDIMLDD